MYRRRRNVPRDPYWLESVRYAGDCAGCGVRIPRGARAFYYPNGRLFGDECGCGNRAWRDFMSARGDELGQPFAT